MSHKTHSVSRRSFLTGAGILAAGSGISIAGMLSGCTPSKPKSKETSESKTSSTQDWLGSAPEIAPSQITSTKETDLLIIGAGNAGLAAAATAADLGLDFLICEKSDSVQKTRHWFGAINSKYTKAAGMHADEGKLLNEFARYASGQCDQRVINTWIKESAEMVDWIDPILTAAGMTCEFDDKIDHKTGGTDYYIAPMQHYYSGKDANGERLERNKILLSYIQEKGYDVTYNHTLTKLLREGENTGRVTGAIFKTNDGYVQINAAKGILLTTGGYVNNAAMIKSQNPMINRCVTVQVGSPNNTGEGIKAAMWIGAQKDAIGASAIFDRGAVLPGQNAGLTGDDEQATFVGESKQFNLGSQPFMKVSREGRRFCNESTPYDSCCFAAAGHEGGVFCQIFDSNLKEDVSHFTTIGCSRQTQGLLAANESTPIDEIYAKEIERGVLIKADTLEELADKLGFADEAKQAFLDEVARYNEFYEKQVDEDFGKEAYRLSAIKKAPFYGCWFGGAILTTLDGIRINKDMQALDTSYRPIEGLFAAGDCSGSLFSNNYPEYIVACCCGRAITFARHAVRYIAGDIK